MNARSAIDGITPIGAARQPRMQDGIVDQLRGLILEGKLAPGTVLRQEHLAARLKVSRTPLREALLALEREGFIVFSPTGAASVVALDATEAREIMDLREVLDGLAARLLAERGLDDELDARLASLVAEMADIARSDKARYLVRNAEFHAAIAEATGHARLQRFVPMVRMSSEVVYMRLQDQGQRLACSAEEHAALLAALRAGDGAAAETIARGHVRAAAAHWLAR